MDHDPGNPSPASSHRNTGRWFIAWIAAMTVGPLVLMGCSELGNVVQEKLELRSFSLGITLGWILYLGSATIVPLILGWKLTLGKGLAARVGLTLLFELMAIVAGSAIGLAECSHWFRL